MCHTEVCSAHMVTSDGNSLGSRIKKINIKLIFSYLVNLDLTERKIYKQLLSITVRLD